MGATEVCLQGGIHPDFDGDYYLDVTRAVKDAVPEMHVHAFTALEVTEGARRLGEPLVDYLAPPAWTPGWPRCPARPPRSSTTPSGRSSAPTRSTPQEWLDAHRAAHEVGLRSNVTIMFGAVEQPRSWARHLVRTRALQHETGGFTEFVPAAVRAHGVADLPPAQVAPRARRSARSCSCTRWAASPTTARSTTSRPRG